VLFTRSTAFLPTDIEGFDSLAELALDLNWSWNHRADEVWRLLDPMLWELTQNPWVVLQTVSRDKLERVLADPAFRRNVDDKLQANPKCRVSSVRIGTVSRCERRLCNCCGVSVTGGVHKCPQNTSAAKNHTIWGRLAIAWHRPRREQFILTSITPGNSLFLPGAIGSAGW